MMPIAPSCTNNNDVSIENGAMLLYSPKKIGSVVLKMF
jgi:hypothetical protein